jgi:hypothetical protein
MLCEGKALQLGRYRNAEIEASSFGESGLLWLIINSSICRYVYGSICDDGAGKGGGGGSSTFLGKKIENEINSEQGDSSSPPDMGLMQ